MQAAAAVKQVQQAQHGAELNAREAQAGRSQLAAQNEWERRKVADLQEQLSGMQDRLRTAGQEIADLTAKGRMAAQQGAEQTTRHTTEANEHAMQLSTLQVIFLL